MRHLPDAWMGCREGVQAGANCCVHFELMGVWTENLPTVLSEEQPSPVPRKLLQVFFDPVAEFRPSDPVPSAL
jgi:hypothetical protein